jgi:hypothetical protein
MSKDQNGKEQEEDRQQGHKDHQQGQKGMNWSQCGKHGITYPSGGTCPSCDVERESSRR